MCGLLIIDVEQDIFSLKHNCAGCDNLLILAQLIRLFFKVQENFQIRHKSGK